MTKPRKPQKPEPITWEHVGIILEDIQSNIRILAEGHTDLRNRMDRLESKVTRLESKVDGLELKVDGLVNQIAALSDQIARNTESLTSFQSQLTITQALDQRVTTLEHKLSTP